MARDCCRYPLHSGPRAIALGCREIERLVITPSPSLAGPGVVCEVAREPARFQDNPCRGQTLHILSSSLNSLRGAVVKRVLDDVAAAHDTGGIDWDRPPTRRFEDFAWEVEE
jgi:hypothetical protein